MEQVSTEMKSPELKRLFPELRDGNVSSATVSRKRDIQSEIASDSEKKRLYDVSLEFQSIFINMMLKSMRSNLNTKNELLHAGMQQDIFEDMLYDEYAKQMSQDKRFNLAEQIYMQLSESLPDAPAAQKQMREAIKGYESNMKSPTPSVSGEQLLDRRF